MSPGLTLTLRLFIVFLSVLAIALIVIINHPVRHEVSFGHVMTRLGVCVFVGAVAYGIVESQLQGVTGASRLWFVTVGLIWLNIGQVALLKERRNEHGAERAQRKDQP